VRIATIPSLALAVVLALAGSAAAGEKAGVRMPDTLEVVGKQLRLNGMGLREATALKINVYVAALYLEEVSSDPGTIVGSTQVKHLVLKFVRDVDRGDIVKAWNDGFRGNATVQLTAIQEPITRMNSWMTDFKKGDTLGFTYVPGQGVHVDVNGAHKGVLAGEDFARSLFSIWLGPRPPSGNLKKGLLGRHGAGA
jgi:hypothetical protein